MKRDEIIALIAVIQATYPTHFTRFDAKMADNLIRSWELVLEGYTYEQASAGLRAYLMTDTKGFPPVPGQVIDCIHKLKTPDMTGNEAWTMVRKALRNGLYGAEEEFAKLPDNVKKAVGSAENLRQLALMKSDELETVEKSHFIRIFDNVNRREKEVAKLPESVRALLTGNRNLLEGA